MGGGGNGTLQSEQQIDSHSNSSCVYCSFPFSDFLSLRVCSSTGSRCVASISSPDSTSCSYRRNRAGHLMRRRCRRSRLRCYFQATSVSRRRRLRETKHWRTVQWMVIMAIEGTWPAACRRNDNMITSAIDNKSTTGATAITSAAETPTGAPRGDIVQTTRHALISVRFGEANTRRQRSKRGGCTDTRKEGHNKH